MSGADNAKTPDRPAAPAWPDLPMARPVAAVPGQPTPSRAHARKVPRAPVGLRMPAPMSPLRAIVELLLLIPAGGLGAFTLSLICYALPLPDNRWFHVADSLGLGLGCLLACGLMLRRAGHRPGSVGWTRNRLGANIGIGLVALLATYVVMIQVVCVAALLDPGIILEKPEAHQAIEENFPPLPVWGALLMMAFVAVWEETVFRGFLLTRLHAVLRRWWLAIPLGAAIFGAIHFYQGVLAVLIVTGLGVVLGTLLVWRKSLVPAIAFHLVFDFVTFQALRWLSPTWR